MKLRYDFEIDLATAHSRMAKKWKNKKWKWSELVARCAETKRTDESVKEYAAMNREEQSAVKDVGGFVGGFLGGGQRKTAAVLWRSMATLDIDYGTDQVWDDLTMQFGFAALLYSTHKHAPGKPRYRIVIPFSRPVKPGEYEPICRKIAEAVGIDLFDVTTYQLARLFYWPSTSRDGEFVFEWQDGPACNPDDFLRSYADYRDASQWPASAREGEVVRREIGKAEDPTAKRGVVGAFCRTYAIEDAIEKFLPDIYEKTASEGRYTYRAGSVAGGLVCYEGRFAYSHHETDPASGKLCNAFDLCRLHLFGVFDEGSSAGNVTRLPSYVKMQEFAAADPDTRKQMAKERWEQAGADFGGIGTADNGGGADAGKGEGRGSMEWMTALDYDKRGVLKPTAGNIMAVLENDAGLKGKLYLDTFSSFNMVRGGLPWDKEAKSWSSRDEANLRIYLENRYSLTGRDKIHDAVVAVMTKNQLHPVREYLGSLEWDGTPRLERLVTDYIGAEDTPLNRAMTRTHFVAAVARVMTPGVKYDHCLIIQGKEGIGKSSLFSLMGGEWFSDSLTTMEGKEGMEQLRGVWILELSELDSMKRSEATTVKKFISKETDCYRPAYAVEQVNFPRQCVFCGTTNERYFLKGDDGNRRFWVIAADDSLRKMGNPREAIIRDRDQLWAEAAALWRNGHPVELPGGLVREARQMQEDFNEERDDPLEGLLRSFLDMKLPPDWPTWDLNRRRAYLRNPDPLEAEATIGRNRFCIAEFVCERLGKDMGDKEYKYLARRVGNIMDRIDGWERVSSSRHAKALYGIQKAFRRTEKRQTEEVNL